MVRITQPWTLSQHQIYSVSQNAMCTCPSCPFQVLICPNPDSCSYASREQQLQQLQVDVRNAYYTQQRTQAIRAETLSPGQRHRSLTMQEPLHPQTDTQDHTPCASDPSNSNITPATLIGSCFSRMRSILTAPGALSPPLLPPPPPSPPPTPRVSPTTSQPSSAGLSAAQTLFIRGFFASSASNMSTYASAQCAPGYTGHLCALCSPGYGSQGIATCKRCPSRSLNTLYYILATLLTLVLLASTFQSAFSEARSLKMEQAEARKRAEEDERVAEEEEQALDFFSVSKNTMQGPNTRILQAANAGKGGRASMAGSGSKYLAPPKRKSQDTAVSSARSLPAAHKSHSHLKAPPAAVVNSMAASAFTCTAIATASPFQQSNSQEVHVVSTFAGLRTQSEMLPDPPVMHEARHSPAAAAGGNMMGRRHSVPVHNLVPLVQHPAQPASLHQTGSGSVVIQEDVVSHITAGSEHSGGQTGTPHPATAALSAAASLPTYLLQPQLSVSLSVDMEANVGVEMAAAPSALTLTGLGTTSVNSMHTWKERSSAESSKSRSKRVKSARLRLFADHRDAVIDDSTRAAVVVNRILVSYLQVSCKTTT